MDARCGNAMPAECGTCTHLRADGAVRLLAVLAVAVQDVSHTCTLHVILHRTTVAAALDDILVVWCDMVTRTTQRHNRIQQHQRQP